MRLPFGSRFLTSLLGSFAGTVLILVGAGYAVTRLTLRQPRDPFRAGSFEFDLAPGWWCERDSSAYVCNPPGQPPYAATVIMAIKERGPDDNLQAYEDFLKQPKSASAGAGPNPLSVVSYVGRTTLAGVQWVEALHLGSEIANYDTYYLATTTATLGILVTMSVDRQEEANYVRQLTDMMNTLHVYQR
jgi:hypothetical protein